VTHDKFALAKQYDFGPDDITSYDIEKREATPTDETANVPSSIAATTREIRMQGYKAGVTPSGDIIMQKYGNINWRDIDFLGLQLQRFTGDTETLVRWANQISEYVKSVNPNTVIFVQLTFRQASNCYDPNETPALSEDCIVDVKQSINKLEYSLSRLAEVKTVDGYIISYLPTDATSWPRNYCPQELCNPANFDRILTYIESIRR
jgi:hypothetical protein